MFLKIAQEAEVNRQVILDVELNDADIEPYLNLSYKSVAAEAKIPGFRPGMAPRSVVERYFGKEHLIRRSFNQLIPEITDKVVNEQGLNLSATPRVEVLEILPVKIKLTVPLEPQVEIGDYSKIRIDQANVNVTASEVNERIEGFRTSLGSWEPVDDRNVRLKDMVTIDVIGYVDNEKLIDQKNVTLVADEGQGTPFKGFATNLVGISINSQKDFDIQVEDDLADDKIKGKLIKFSVTVHEIKEQNLPKVDDEFAKSAGDGYDSLSSMKKSIRQEIVQNKKDQSDKEYTDQVLDQFDQLLTIELPPLLIDYEIDNLVSQRNNMANQLNMSPDDYLKMSGKTQEEVDLETRSSAIQRLRHSYGLEKLASNLKIDVTPKEIDEKIREILEFQKQRGSTEQSYDDMISNDVYRSSVEQSIKTSKSLEKLVLIAKGESKPAIKSNKKPTRKSDQKPKKPTSKSIKKD
ncbi:MAG: trigger factor [SAR202 cluster bacterium]|nr:trigger factor [SAR202 cluster bacterium]